MGNYQSRLNYKHLSVNCMLYFDMIKELQIKMATSKIVEKCSAYTQCNLYLHDKLLRKVKSQGTQCGTLFKRHFCEHFAAQSTKT
jgi:hypothetical protein